MSHDPQTTPQMTPYEPGQIWTPTHGLARAKVITYIGRTGTIYAAKFPRSDALPTCFSRRAWRRWIDEYGAQWTRDVQS